MSAQKMCIYSYKIGHGILTYYRGGVHVESQRQIFGWPGFVSHFSPSFSQGFRALPDCIVAFGI